jgi:hypothetical protein
LHFLTTTTILALVTATAAAEPAHTGIGVGVGVATGPNLQVLTSDTTHLDVGVGLQFDERLRVQADHAWRLVDLANARSVGVPLYLGIGGFVTDRRWGVSTGLRMPVGVQADFVRAPIQLFGEIAPELALVVDSYMEPPPELALTGLIGVRAAL